MNALTLNKNNLEPVLQLQLSNVIDNYLDVLKMNLDNYMVKLTLVLILLLPLWYHL